MIENSRIVRNFGSHKINPKLKVKVNKRKKKKEMGEGLRQEVNNDVTDKQFIERMSAKKADKTDNVP